MNRVIKILMERDHMTEQEAKELVRQAREDMLTCAEEGDYSGAEDIMYSLLGLEMDYIMDIL